MSVYKIYIHFFFHYFNYCGMVTLLFGLSMIGFILLEGQKCYWMPCVELLTWYRLEWITCIDSFHCMVRWFEVSLDTQSLIKKSKICRRSYYSVIGYVCIKVALKCERYHFTFKCYLFCWRLHWKNIPIYLIVLICKLEISLALFTCTFHCYNIFLDVNLRILCNSLWIL